MTRLVTVFATILVFAACTPACGIIDRPRSTSAVSPAGSSGDVLGAGGRQDDLAREIYHPGRGTDW